MSDQKGASRFPAFAHPAPSPMTRERWFFIRSHLQDIFPEWAVELDFLFADWSKAAEARSRFKGMRAARKDESDDAVWRCWYGDWECPECHVEHAGQACAFEPADWRIGMVCYSCNRVPSSDEIVAALQALGEELHGDVRPLSFVDSGIAENVERWAASLDVLRKLTDLRLREWRTFKDSLEARIARGNRLRYDAESALADLIQVLPKCACGKASAVRVHSYDASGYFCADCAKEALAMDEHAESAPCPWVSVVERVLGRGNVLFFPNEAGGFTVPADQNTVRIPMAVLGPQQDAEEAEEAEDRPSTPVWRRGHYYAARSEGMSDGFEIWEKLGDGSLPVTLGGTDVAMLRDLLADLEAAGPDENWGNRTVSERAVRTDADARSLLVEGMRAARAVLHPVPAVGHFLTPQETERSRVALEAWLVATEEFLTGEDGT